VIVGIGHEQDQSVLDAVARRAKTPTAAAGLLVDHLRATNERTERTGSTILDRAKRSIRDARTDASERERRLAREVRFRLDRARAEIGDFRSRGARAARGAILHAARGLARLARSVPRAARIRVAANATDLERVARHLLAGARRDVSESGVKIGGASDRLVPAVSRVIEHESERLTARERRLRLGDPRRVVERGYAILRGSGGVVTAPAHAPEGAEITAELRDGRLKLRSEGTESDG
jgi:exodeoxyribonuclease VII large subunit